MKRTWLFLIVVVVALMALAYALRIARQNPVATVSSLLPPDTIAFVHVPDFNRTRDEWHHSDIYQLFHEPAVEEFLGKPLARFRKTDALSRTLQEIEQLGPKDLFLALTSLDIRKPEFVAGFRFRGKRDAAETIIGQWRSKLLAKNRTAKHEKLAYQKHEIEIAAAPAFTLATVYAGRWFFASNDVARLKALLDRADGRGQDRQAGLQANQAYRTAVAHMPSDYAGLVYLQPKTFTEKLALLRNAIGEQIPSDQQALLEKITSICGTARFERGKIHEVVFTGMPEVRMDAKLTRSALALGTADTFFYVATLFDPKNLGAVGQAGGIPTLGRWVQKFLQSISNGGITNNDWKAAFGLEMASLADWSPTAHWPSLIVTLPVKDRVRANKIAGAITAGIDEDARWSRTEKNGVSYFSMATPAGLFAITPTVALSDRLLVVGVDSASVETAMKTSQGSAAGLSSSQSYKAAARSLPEPTNFFAYIDTPLLYSRLDAALRPMLLLGAAFLPAVSDRVDLDKLPPPETVTKHLSPIVSSQRYDHDGYVVESVGPITLNQAMIGFGLSAFWAVRMSGAAYAH